MLFQRLLISILYCPLWYVYFYTSRSTEKRAKWKIKPSNQEKHVFFTLPVRLGTAHQPLYFWTFPLFFSFQNKKYPHLLGLCEFVCVCPWRIETCSNADRHSAESLGYFKKGLGLNWDAEPPADSCVWKRLWCHLAILCLLFCSTPPPHPRSAPDWPLFQMISLINNVHHTAETRWMFSSTCAPFQLLSPCFFYFFLFCACGFMCTGFNR